MKNLNWVQEYVPDSIAREAISSTPVKAIKLIFNCLKSAQEKAKYAKDNRLLSYYPLDLAREYYESIKKDGFA